MSNLREAAQQALEALEQDNPAGRTATIAALRAALEQQAEPAPVAHRVVAGALFDFMGWLTSRRERLVLSSTDDAAPAADAIKDFAEMRGLSLDDAKVQDWNTAPPQQAEPAQEPAGWFEGPFGAFRANQLYKIAWPASTVAWSIPLFTAPPQRKPLTDAEIVEAVRGADLDWQAGWTLDEHEPNRFTTLARAIEHAHGIGEEE